MFIAKAQSRGLKGINKVLLEAPCELNSLSLCFNGGIDGELIQATGSLTVKKKKLRLMLG